jgi:hypothetical protein
MLQVSRRSLLQTGAAGAVAAPLAASALAAPASAATTAQFVGHVPNKVYVGVSGLGFEITAQTGAVGLRRTFYKWDGVAAEIKAIQADHAASRLPWTSFKPPGSASTTWKQIGDGVYDSAIRARARSYATLTKPVIVTFNHEPQTDSGAPSEYARAWIRIHDVMKAETGLKNVIHAPILGEWCWNPVNRRHNPADWMTAGVLSRAHFLGIDLYQTMRGETYEQRVARVFSWLDERGHSTKMVGIGETGCSDDFTTIKGAAWWTASWKYAEARKDRFFATSYFNNLHNNNQGYNWLLTQSSAKLTAFTASVKSTSATKLPAS